MKFLRQIKYEIRNILKSKFLMIIGILVLLTSIGLPVFNLVNQRQHQRPGDGIVRPMSVDSIYYEGRKPYPPWGGGQEPIIVDDVTILPDNPFYWNVSNIKQEMESMESARDKFTSPEVLDLILELMEFEMSFYVRYARHINSYMDYRVELAYRGIESIYDKFFYERHEVNPDHLLEAGGYRRGYDPVFFKDKYINITPEARLAALDRIDETLGNLYAIAENNDFPKYIEMRIQQELDVVRSMHGQIAQHEQEIIKNPSQEEFLNQMIVELRRQILLIEESSIPILELRRDRNIIPGEDTWQNSALSDIQNSRNQLAHTNILPEEKFFQEPWLVQQHGSYAKYYQAMQMQIDELNKTIIIGQKSIDADMPDMKYVHNGARSRTIQFLSYSVFVALFAVLLGGWLMASEFQQGTIRLLMIRPKTRMKILMAKFIAAFVLSIGIYTAGSILNLITNGILFGFGDFSFPNYTIAGQLSFFAYYAPKFLACTVTIIFAFSVAFMLSVLVKNAAVSIAVPIAGFIASNMVMAAFSWRGEAGWLAYTPIPYIQISYFFIQYSPVQQLIRRGLPISLTYGILLLLALSALCTLFSVLVFNTRDITN